jgi:hypothetical protein
VKGICFKGLAVVLPGCPIKDTRTGDIDHNGCDHDSERPIIDLDVSSMIQKAMGCLVDDPETCHQKKKGFKKSRKIFRLAMTIKMVAVRRFSRDSDRQESHHCSHEIESGMGSFGKDAQTPGAKAYDNLKSS